MEACEYKNIFEHEETHFFYVTVRELILSLARRYLSQSSGTRSILDAGCGTGGLVLKLRDFGHALGLDVCEEALNFSNLQGATAIHGSIENLPCREDEFDLVTCVDVIYHENVQDDVRALAQIYRVLKPGALLVLRVPAFNSLYSSHDKLVKTARRYRKSKLKTKLEQSGFEILRLTYNQASLFAPAWLKARVEHAAGSAASSAIGATPKILNQVLTAILRMENKLILAGVDLPVGVGLIAVARKPHAERLFAEPASCIAGQTTATGDVRLAEATGKHR